MSASRTSPIFNYPYARTREALERLARFREIDAWQGHKMRYVNPVTGGWAMGKVVFSDLFTASTGQVLGTTTSRELNGWTVGAGVEFAATEDLSVDLQYRYSDYGDADYTFGIFTNSLGLTSHQVTVGLNWGF